MNLWSQVKEQLREFEEIQIKRWNYVSQGIMEISLHIYFTVDEEQWRIPM